jgi:hypothetical protein
LVASDVWQVCSMGGDGGGRASLICRGAVTRCWVSVPGDYFVHTKCRGRFSSHVAAPDASLVVVCGGLRPRPAWRSSLADLSHGLSAAEVAGGRGGVGGGWRLLRMTSVLRRPLVWIWALPVDVGVPIVLVKVSPLPVSLVVGWLRGA